MSLAAREKRAEVALVARARRLAEIHNEIEKDFVVRENLREDLADRALEIHREVRSADLSSLLVALLITRCILHFAQKLEKQHVRSAELFLLASGCAP